MEMSDPIRSTPRSEPKTDAWGLYCETYRQMMNGSVRLSPAVLQEFAERLRGVSPAPQSVGHVSPEMIDAGRAELERQGIALDPRSPEILLVPLYSAMEAARPPSETEAKWIPVAERLPEPHRRLLVTNNINAEDAFGQMSHVWLVRMIHEPSDTDHENKGWIAFDDYDGIIESLTHWRYAL
jgi:hypothetical protein